MKIIDPIYEIEQIKKWIKNYFTNNGGDYTKAVIGISGGKDSTVAAALLCEALGPQMVVCVMMPCGEQADIADSRAVIEHLRIPPENVWTLNIQNAVNACLDTIGGQKANAMITTNTPARIRMIMLYQVAAIVGGRVCNTSNASESYIGYCTKYGDFAGDFALLQHLYVRDVIEIGIALGLPRHLVEKAPADGMCGSTDEDRLGFSYTTLDDYLIDGICPEYFDLRLIEDMHKRSEHKRNAINLPRPSCISSRHDEDEEWSPPKRGLRLHTVFEF